MNYKTMSNKVFRSLLPALLFVAALIVLLSTGASAQKKPMRANMNLTGQQRQKLQRHIQESRRKTSDVSQDLSQSRMALFKQLRDYSVSETQLQSSIRRINGLQIKRHRVELENQLGLRKILTREQFAKLGDAVSEKGSSNHRASSGNKLSNNVKRLDLTPEQQKKINALFEKSRVSMQSIRQKIRSNNQSLHKLYLNYDLNAGQANARINDLGKTQLSALKAMVARQIALRHILTKEQFKTLAQTMRPPTASR